jgi:Putative beta-lactamase-inhibitor-like, PepSY-like
MSHLDGMKNWIVALALGGAGFCGLQAQQVVRKTAVPLSVVEEFEYRFANAESIVWLKQGDDYYGARFQIKGQDAEAIYTPTGEWIQTEQDIAYLEMPDSARSYCRSHYPDYQAQEVKKVSTRRHGILYEIKVLGGMKQVGMTFDMHGRLIDEKEQAEEGNADAPAEKEGMKGKLNSLLKKKED